MPTYFDPIMQEDTVLDENTIVYLVKIGDNKFSIKAISSGLEHLDRSGDLEQNSGKIRAIPSLLV
ncbi:hypothetical protein [Legionella pneumophila]|uniref:hypothetical protein n=1 Tax=Legionella pneumophila TaxID=446 RepID=UPI003B00EB6B